MDPQLLRIRETLAERRLSLNPPASEAHVRAFEERHRITLPDDYRRFITELGDGGPGPPDYGLVPLGEPKSDMGPQERRFWTELPLVRHPFPFTRYWVWEDGEESSEGGEADICRGSIYLGTDGCAMYWHLIVTGPDRGIPWMLSGEGIQPVCPKRTFLPWYEDWLDGRGPFDGFGSHDGPSG